GAGGAVGAGMKSPQLRLLGAAKNGADAVGHDEGRAITNRGRDAILGGPRHQAGERDQDRLHEIPAAEWSQRRAASKERGSRPANGFWCGGHGSRGFSYVTSSMFPSGSSKHTDRFAP